VNKNKSENLFFLFCFENITYFAIRNTIIFAAGMGERLFPFTKTNPKPLIPFLGKKLLEHLIETLKEANVKDLVIVTGYLHHFIQQYFGDGLKFDVKIEYVFNSFYEKGNFSSLKAARELLDEEEDFLLLMADHVIDVEIVNKALLNTNHTPLLCIDRQPHRLVNIKEATKVLVDPEGYIVDIGKDIANWNGIDTGVFLFNSNIFEELEKTNNLSHFTTISEYIKKMITNRKPLWASDVTGYYWFDIDTVDDIQNAEMILRGKK